MFSPLSDAVYRNTSPKLDIQLEGGDKQTFCPGDTIIGSIIRRAPIVAPSGSIRLSLHGRSVVKITEGSGRNESKYSGEVTLIQDLKNSQVLFEGPLHVAEGPEGVPQSWAFAVDVPLHVELNRPDVGLGEHSYLPVSADTMRGTYPLPDTFSSSSSSFSESSSCRIEYFIKAVLFYHSHGGGSSSSSGGRTSSALLPITLRTRNHNPPIADFHTVQRTRPTCVQSYHLLPGMDSSSSRLSLLQRAQSAVGSSKVPILRGALELTTPTVVQAGNPQPLPILIRFVPDYDRSNHAVRGHPPKVRLLSLLLRVHGLATVQCRGGWSSSIRRQTCKRRSECTVWPTRAGKERTVYLSCSDEWPALDVGAEARFGLGGGGLGMAQRLLPVLTPSFETFNIKQQHRFEYELVVEIAGEEVKARINEEVTILPPSEGGPAGLSRAAVVDGVGVGNEEWEPSPFNGRSESWIRPPAETEAPPSFDDATMGKRS